jgi:endoglucanase
MSFARRVTFDSGTFTKLWFHSYPLGNVRPVSRRIRHQHVLVALLCALGLLVVGVAITGPGRTPEAQQSSSSARTALNPLEGRPWGVYQGSYEKVTTAYAAAQGTDRALLGKIALQPRAAWFGGWQSSAQAVKQVTKYLATMQAGNPETLVQITIFRLRPWAKHREVCRRLPNAAEQAAYRSWVDAVATALGTAHVALILQPDSPFVLCAPGGSTLPQQLLSYATQRFEQQPNVSVYIEAGAADWLKDDVSRALQILVPSGIAYARGFAFNGTHYDSTERQIRFGARVSDALAAQGIPGKTFVINTAQNGRPFPGYAMRARGSFDHRPVCTRPEQQFCVALGIPPTTDVANPVWGLPPDAAALAQSYVDAYLWFGRPWLYMQNDPFQRARALKLAANAPFL